MEIKINEKLRREIEHFLIDYENSLGDHKHYWINSDRFLKEAVELLTQVVVDNDRSS